MFWILGWNRDRRRWSFAERKKDDVLWLISTLQRSTTNTGLATVEKKKTKKQEELVAYFYFIICHDVSSFNSKSSN